MSLAQSNLSPSKVSSKFSSPASKLPRSLQSLVNHLGILLILFFLVRVEMTSIFAKTKLKTKTLIKNLKEQNSAQDSGLWHPSQERFARLPGEVAGVNEPEVVPPSTP